jgi:elongation factor Ts
MAITTEQIKELRDKTGISVMQCKKALEEAGGDMEKALLILKKKSTEIAAKKSDREATAGIVVKAEKAGSAILLTLRCETDFVAKNADFSAIARKWCR